MSYHREYYKRNAGRIKAAAKARYDADPSKFNASHKTVNGRFIQAKSKAKRTGYIWNITFEQFEQLAALDCNYCQLSVGDTFGSALDRVNADGDYTYDNVVTCCKECNTARMDHFTSEEMRLHIGPAIRAVKQARQSAAKSLARVVQ